LVNGYVKIGRVDDFPLGKMRKVEVAGGEVLVANVDGRIYAVGGKCTHRGGPLDEGELEGAAVICPWHGGRFDLATGTAIVPPPTKNLSSFEVQVDGSNILVRKR
jgi:3-phenylpropionate/trans-cinnamate dioxygenase ferredoxin subunit